MAKKKTKKPVKKTGKKKAAKKPVKKQVKKPAKKKPAKKKAVKKAAPAEKTTTTINAYLNFNGNCEEAFNFYKSVFGGKFDYVGRFNEMPADPNKPMPAADANKIMHVSLPISKETILMGSDTMDGYGPPFNAGNNFNISIHAVTKNEADRLFNALAAGGHVIMPMNNTFWGSYFGMLVDKFGIGWMVNFATRPA
jgi:PhnB protein